MRAGVGFSCGEISLLLCSTELKVTLLSIEDNAMHRIAFLLITVVLLFVFQSAHSEESTAESQGAAESSESDSRQLVSMPAQTREIMRNDMLDHLSALNEILGYLADNDLDMAADVAESRLGRSAMGRHRASGMGPGRFMPLEMRNIGWGMHEAATEFSQIAKQGDIKSAYGALQNVTTSCVVCHYSYRTR